MIHKSGAGLEDFEFCKFMDMSHTLFTAHPLPLCELEKDTSLSRHFTFVHQRRAINVQICRVCSVNDVPLIMMPRAVPNLNNHTGQLCWSLTVIVFQTELK